VARAGYDAAKTAQQTYANEANQTFGAEQSDISKFGQNIAQLAAGKQVGANPYQNPAYLANQAQLQSGVLSGANAAADTQLKQSNRRSGGLNTGSTQGAISGLALQKMRLGDELTAQRSSNDYAKNIAFQQYLANAPITAAGAEQGAFGTATQGQSSALNNLTQADIAAMQAQYGLATSAISAAGAACPAKGALYLMSDGTERKVEELKVDDLITGIDDEPQLIEEILSSYSPTVWVHTENGLKTRNSWTHAFALPKGGFTVAAKSIGKIIATKLGPSKVVAVDNAGTALVFNVITDGSHTYRADGVWAYGVGDAERHISMKEWCAVGERLVRAGGSHGIR
jgi:hypothetical protein